MSLEQKLEQSEQLLETNEENKREVERSQRKVRQAQTQVSACNARVRSCQAQLQQAIAARNAAQQRAADDQDGGSVSPAYDTAVESARNALSEAETDLLHAEHEHIRASEDLSRAETAQRESAEQLRGVTGELREVSRKYGLEMSKTQALMSMPEGHLASRLFGNLGAGRDKVNDLRRRIAASLGIPMESDDSPSASGGSASRYGRASRGRMGNGSAYGGSSVQHASSTLSPKTPGAVPIQSSLAASQSSATPKQNSAAPNKTSAVSPQSSIPIGWCQSNSMSAVKYESSGAKVVSLKIGEFTRDFPCTKTGMAQAYQAAVETGDSDLMARTSAMFEIETLREDLELGVGDSNYPQLGGYHRDVRTQDPAGFESHHIPARSVQDVNAEWLPAVSITKEDHKLTSSYAAKQKHVYEPLFPSNIPSVNYKESITQNLERGSSGYIDSVKAELYDLRVTTGHRYDGAVSAYLDAVIDMLACKGIPDAKRSAK